MDLIQKLLVYNPENRISALEALEHPWIREQVVEHMDTQATMSAFKNLTSFRVHFSEISTILDRTKATAGCSDVHSVPALDEEGAGETVPNFQGLGPER